MKKSILSVLAIMACTLTFAATQVQIGDLWYELDGTEATVIQDMSGSKTNYVHLTKAFIPSSVKYETHEYTVTRIAESAFSACPELLAVSIPSSVTYVGNKAFANCTWLDSVAWHPVRMYSTSYAYNTCPFYNDKKITKFTFGPTVQRIPAYLCYDLDGITELHFPAGLQFIANYAFNHMDGIKAVTIPDGVNSMGTGPFSSCYNLASINIPSSLEAIPDEFCNGCSALTQIDIPSTVTSIGKNAFYGTSLSSVVIPESVSSVGEKAFAYNSYLKTVVWNPIRLTAGYDAYNTAPFYNCSNVSSFTFGANVKRIPANLCYYLSAIPSIELPAGLEFIGKAAFCGLSQIKEVVIPDGVSVMGSSVFSSCTNLASINIPAALTEIPGYFCNGSSITEIDIPLKITSIGAYAFGATKLTSVTIPEDVTYVGECAFYNCPNLKTVVWNAKSATAPTSTNTIPFYKSQLNSITFGEKVTYISNYLCYNQPTITEVYNYAAVPQTIQGNVFYNVDKETCVLYVPKESLEDYKNKDVWKEFLHMTGVLATLKYEDVLTTISYLGQEQDTLHKAAVTLYMPIAPVITGYKFAKWEVVAGDFADGIVLQAVYEKDEATMVKRVASQDSNAESSKLIRRGNVYILRDDKVFTMKGQQIPCVQ